MFTRIVIAVSLLLCPLMGTAQAWLPQIQTDSASAAAPMPLLDELLALNVAPPQGLLMKGDRVVPLWASSDGHWLALVAYSQSSNGPMLPLAPALGGLADWRLMDARGMVSGGMRWRLGSGFYADALFGQSSKAPACRTGVCAAVMDAGSSSFTSTVRSGNLGFGWLSAGGQLDLSYGLSWLQADSDRSNSAFRGYDNGLPMLAIPGEQSYLVDSSTSLVANGRWNPGIDAPVVTFGASWGRGQALAAGQPGAILLQPIDLTQASLSLGIGTDTLRGVVVGRMLRSDDPALATRKWSALDLGVSWRTPWQGELSVGAQNVWSSSNAAPADKVDPAQARMPYIQYRQDL